MENELKNVWKWSFEKKKKNITNNVISAQQQGTMKSQVCLDIFLTCFSNCMPRDVNTSNKSLIVNYFDFYFLVLTFQGLFLLLRRATFWPNTWFGGCLFLHACTDRWTKVHSGGSWEFGHVLKCLGVWSVQEAWNLALTLADTPLI